MFVTVVTYSQPYHKLIRINTYWDICNIVEPAFCYTSANRIYFTGQDTIPDTTLYQISAQFPFQQINPGPFCPPFQILNSSYDTYYYMREDTLARKVYCSYGGPYNELLIYDFSLNVGDTLQSPYYSQWSYPLICTSIENITLQNGEVRKKFNFPYNDFYIESIGGRNGLFEPIGLGGEIFSGIFCVSENNIPLYGNYCNSYFVGTNDPKNNEEISIFPNPVHDCINIRLNTQLSECMFSLLNLQGQLILKRYLDKQVNAISVSNVMPGVYYYQIRNDKVIKIGKICIF
jgi:hypothetical protein